MKTYIYYCVSEDTNEVIISQKGKGCWSFNGHDNNGYFDTADLYAKDSVEQIRNMFEKNIGAGEMDLSGCCDIYNENFIDKPFEDFKGEYDSITLCAEFDYEPLI